MLSIYLLSLTKLLDKLSELVLWLLLIAFFCVCRCFFFFVCFSNVESLICARTHGHALMYLWVFGELELQWGLFGFGFFSFQQTALSFLVTWQYTGYLCISVLCIPNSITGLKRFTLLGWKHNLSKYLHTCTFSCHCGLFIYFFS